MQNINDKLIVPLDVGTLDRARYFIDMLYPMVKSFKIGGQLFTAYGPDAVKMVGAKGARVFLDLKFHDIPNTVFAGVVSGTALSCAMIPRETEVKENAQVEALHWPVFMMTVHIDLQGDEAMLKKAVEGAQGKAKELGRDKPYIVGVTVLTSDACGEDTLEIVLKKAKLAKEAGLDGVVCSVGEAAAVRKTYGNNFIIVTPGIRPRGAPKNDQKRTATPSEAIKAGANFIVVGRPILEAEDPRKAAEAVIRELS